MIPIRLYAYAAIALAIGFLVWREHHAVQRAKALVAENSQLTASIAAERKNRAIEQDDRRKADESAKSLEAQLAAINAAPKSISMLCRAHLPSTASQGGTASRPSNAATGPSPDPALTDVGDLIRAVWIEAKSNDARHAALIGWERARTH